MWFWCMHGFCATICLQNFLQVLQFTLHILLPRPLCILRVPLLQWCLFGKAAELIYSRRAVGRGLARGGGGKEKEEAVAEEITVYDLTADTYWYISNPPSLVLWNTSTSLE
jgi:hypothetical protein